MENRENLPEEEKKIPAPQEEKAKSMLQIEKESWYDKLPLNLKQLDTIITVCWILIFVLIVVIALDAMDVFNPFGY